MTFVASTLNRSTSIFILSTHNSTKTSTSYYIRGGRRLWNMTLFEMCGTNPCYFFHSKVKLRWLLESCVEGGQRKGLRSKERHHVVNVNC